MLELLVEAAYTRNKESPLRRANLRLEVVRHLWRLAHELKAIAMRQYEHGAKVDRRVGPPDRRLAPQHGAISAKYMKRLGGIWPQLVSFQNLLLAYRKARRGKRGRPGVAEFGLDLERELIALQRELENGEYKPGAYRLFMIYDRKPRVIAAAPFRDRVVHHAVMNLIEPPLDRTFISDSYACRHGKGVHAAVDRYQAWAQSYKYVLKMDVRQYFPSIDHEILKGKLRRRIKDERVLDLLDRIIDGSPDGNAELYYFPGDDLFTPLERRVGIPIGNLTSQFFANLYLDDLDHFIKQQLNVRPYLRYVDDMVVLDNDKVRLAEIRSAVRCRLEADRLRLHPNKAHITRVA